MIHLDETVIVEGKYDKIRLSSFIDARIITTDGFGIFKNREKTELIRKAAEKNGIIIMTDSDGAGFLIRSYLLGCVPPDRITNVFVPQIRGKERRKTESSAEGFLGVEGLGEEIIAEALKKAGVMTSKGAGTKPLITKSDFYELGLIGADDSKKKREQLQKRLELPVGMSSSQLLTAVNCIYERDEFIELLKGSDTFERSDEEGKDTACSEIP